MVQITLSTHLREVRCDNCPVCKFSPSESLESTRGRFCGLELDEYLAYARRLPAATDRSGDLQFDDGTELHALFTNIVANF
jgi:hypothetical protein